MRSEALAAAAPAVALPCWVAHTLSAAPSSAASSPALCFSVGVPGALLLRPAHPCGEHCLLLLLCCCGASPLRVPLRGRSHECVRARSRAPAAARLRPAPLPGLGGGALRRRAAADGRERVRGVGAAGPPMRLLPSARGRQLRPRPPPLPRARSWPRPPRAPTARCTRACRCCCWTTPSCGTPSQRTGASRAQETIERHRRHVGGARPRRLRVQARPARAVREEELRAAHAPLRRRRGARLCARAPGAVRGRAGASAEESSG